MSRRYQKKAIFVLIVVTNVWLALAAEASANEERKWKPEDSVRIRYYSPDLRSPELWHGSRGKRKYIHWSSTSKHFFLVSHRGKLEHDSNEYVLDVYDATAICGIIDKDAGADEKYIEPAFSIVKESKSSLEYSAPFSNAHWSADGSAIYYYAAEAPTGQANAVFKVDVASGKEALIYSGPERVDPFGLKVRCNTAIALIKHPRKDYSRAAMYPVVAVEKNRLDPSDYWRFYRKGGIRIGNAGQTRVVEGTFDWGTLEIAADGSKVGGICFEYDQRWRRGEECDRESAIMPPLTRTQFVIIDTLTGLLSPVVDVERVWSTEISVAWLSESSVVFGPVVQPKSSGLAEVLEFDCATKIIRTVSLGERRSGNKIERVRGIECRNGQLTLEWESGDGIRKSELFAQRGGEWYVEAYPVPDNDEVPKPFDVRLVQDVNTPPVVRVFSGDKSLTLGQADRAEDGIRMERTETIEWFEDGKRIVAGLTLPEKKGEIFPLVVQVYGFDPEVFLPDGWTSSGYAKQALAARGFAVLDLPKVSFAENDVLPAEEALLLLARLEHALRLVRQRVDIDVAKVGLIGFSRAGYQVLNACIQAGTMELAAAVCVDSFTGTLPSYYRSGARSEDLGVYYGGPLWKEKQYWLEREPLWNLDRLRTPILFSKHTDGAADGLNIWERGVPTHSADVIGAFWLSRRPFEYLFFGEGTHNLQRPRERLALMTACVEWFCFWLQGIPPSDVVRAERWALLRKQQDEVLKTPPPPKGKWVFQPDPVQAEWHPPGEVKSAADVEDKKPEPVPARKN